jgi:hypothetical protein
MIQFVQDDGGRAAAGFTGKTGDCVARAICIATGLPYTIVYDRLAEGNATQRRSKSSKNHRACGVRTASHGIWTKRKWFHDYMTELGFVWVPTMKIGSGCKVHLDAKELPLGRLVVSLSRHMTAMVDGVIHDTYDPRREKSYNFEPDTGQELKANQGRNQNGVWTEIGGRCCYGYYRLEKGS